MRTTLSYLKLTDTYIMTKSPVSSVCRKRVNANHIEKYQRGLDNEVLLRNTVASTISKDSDIDLLCSSISSSVLSRGDKHLPKSKFKRHLKPYWNNDLSESHKQMRTSRNKWVQYGRPRDTDNVFYKEYKTSKHNV